MVHAIMQLADLITKAKLTKHLVREQVSPEEFAHEVISDVGNSTVHSHCSPPNTMVLQGHPTPGASDSYEPAYKPTLPEGLKGLTKQGPSTLLLMRGLASL